MRLTATLIGVTVLSGVPVAVAELSRQAREVADSEFVFESAPFASAHASTIVETREGLVAAWFGGTREGAADVGIWVSRRVSGKWTPPIEVANGIQADGGRYPCWNPVLFEQRDKTLMLFYKVGPNPQSWWGMLRTSRDGGRTWTDARRLPDGILGPIKNKPVQLTDGTVVAPSSTESPERPSKWRVHFERTSDGGLTWTPAFPSASADGSVIDAIQPSILIHPGGRLQALGRTRSQRIFETWSDDGGRSWTPIALTGLPNPNAGIDAVTLRDGRHLIVYNHTTKGRSPLNVAVSRDGKVWEAALTLENEAGEYSYPAVIQSADGLVHVTYTWKRQRIKHVAIEPAQLRPAGKGGDDRNGAYDAVAGWWKPAPGHDAVWTWGEVSGLAVDTPDRIIVAVWGDRNRQNQERPNATNYLVVVNRNGDIVERWQQWDSIVNKPHQVYISPYDPERHVWIVERGGGRDVPMSILKFTNDGKRLVMRLGDGGDPRNRAEARAIPKPGPFDYGDPACLAFLPDGSFLLADGYWNSRIVKYNARGEYVMEWGTLGKGPGQFDLVHGVAVDRERRVYVADRTNNRIQVFTENGTFIEEWPDITDPVGVYIDQSDAVWVVSAALNRILKYNRDGVLQYHWGAYGGTRGGFAGGLSRPHQIDVDQEGNVYIASWDGGWVTKHVPKPGADSLKLVGQKLVIPR